MADRSHLLTLSPIARPVRDRKKRQYRVPRRVRHRSPKVHSEHLGRLAIQALGEYEQSEVPEGTARKQILRIELGRRVTERKLERNGLLTLDSSRPDEVIAVSRDPAMSPFQERVSEYGQAPDVPERPEDMDDNEPDPGPRAKHEEVFDSIDGFARLAAAERVSARLTSQLTEAGPEESFHILVDLFSPTDTELREAWIREVAAVAERYTAEPVELFDDPAIGVTLFRLTAGKDLVEELALLAQVALIDAPEPPRLTRPRLASLQDLERLDPEVETPDETAPAVGIIDSGLRLDHPLIEQVALGADAVHPAFGGRGEDGFGHGTLVAGLALYGDVLAAAGDQEFVANFPIASVRIFDDDGCVPRDADPARLLNDAIEHLVEEYDCRVICLSLGDHNEPFLAGMKASALAALIDDAARTHDVVMVVPTGNIQHSLLVAPAQLLPRYPEYLADPGNELLSPSQAALAITVGAIAERDVTDLLEPNAKVAAPAMSPAPYARRGPGVSNSLKPDLVEDGGNWVFDSSTGDILDDTGTAVTSLSARDGVLFDTAIGSSFAAARVANAAASIATAYPQLSAAGIRALLLQGAVDLIPPDASGQQERRALLGHGRVDLHRCIYSSDDRVIMLAEESLRPDQFHVYRLPAQSDFIQASGVRHLVVGLAFDPPVRYRRFDYMALQMECLVVRGLSEDAVFHLASSQNRGKLSELSRKQFSMQPSTSINGRAANQLARATLKTRPREQYRTDDWFVVVRSLDRWMKDKSPQPYALSIGLEVEGSTKLYTQLENAIRLEDRLRARS